MAVVETRIPAGRDARQPTHSQVLRDQDRERMRRYYDMSDRSPDQAPMVRNLLQSRLPVQVLVDKPEWFDPTTPELDIYRVLEAVSADEHLMTPGFVSMLEKIREKDIPSVKEELNPFRGNRLTTILTSVRMIIAPSDQPKERDYSPEFAGWIGDRSGELLRRMNDLFDTVVRKKMIGKLIQSDEKYLLIHREIDDEHRARILYEIESLSAFEMITREEARSIYAIGELVSRFLGPDEGSMIGMPLSLEERERMIPACFPQEK